MASGRLFLPGWMPARDSNGDPIPNVVVSFYQNETDVLASVYADDALTIPLTNPVAANSSGRFPQIYASDAMTYSASVEAPYGPAGQPFTFDGLEVSQAADIAAANLAQGAAEDAEAASGVATTALVEIEDIIINAPDAPSVANKANRDLDNVTTADFSAKGLIPTGSDTAASLSDNVTIYARNQGAVPNVLDSASAALNVAALNKTVPTGRTLDLQGQIYAIDGRWTSSVTPRLANGTFRQIATTGTARDIMVVIDGKNGFSIDSVLFDLANIQARAGVTFGNTYAVHIKNCSGFTVRNSRVVNGGGHTGWLVENCTDFDWIDTDARDFNAIYAVAPTDDVACGVSFVNSTKGRIRGGHPGNISASWTGQPTPRRLFSRGMSFSGCSDFDVRGVQVDFVDQGFDNTGGGINHDMYFWDIAADDCSTFGFKASNRCYNIFVNGMRIDRPGWAGTHTTSSLSLASTPYVQNIQYKNVHVHNVGQNSIYTSSDGRNAYQIVQTGLTPGYPAGVTYDNCTWTDDQTTKTVDAAFAQRGTITPRTPTSTIPINWIKPSCLGEGLAIGGVAQSGMNFPSATVTGTSTPLALVTNTITPLVYNVVVYDPSVMIDLVNGRIYAVVEGDYDVGCVQSFSNAAAGVGELFLYKNGSEVGANYRASARLDPTSNVRVELASRPIRMLRGDYVSIQGRQQSGSNMNIALNGGLFYLRLRNPFS